MFHSFYIHWPFCPYRCHFCPFIAFVGQDRLMLPYHQALKQEMLAFYQQQEARSNIKTIYFGGGTPSTYPDDLLLDIVGTLKDVSSFSEEVEITLEVNPGTVTVQKLELWKALGINRLSVGVQSLNEKALRDVQRLQTNDYVYFLLDNARNLFQNINVDFILGLPHVSATEWKEQIKRAVQWPITHIAVYFLMVHEFTPLYYRVKKKDLSLLPDEELVELYCWTIDYLKEYGFEQYEISNFARKGFQAVHNKAYWQRKPYRGFGVGAWSFDGKSRFMNRKNLTLYMQNVNEGNSVESIELLDDEQVALESIMLGMRQTEGLSEGDYYHLIGANKRECMQERIEQLIAQELLAQRNGRLQLTAKGLAVEQEVITKLSL